MAIAWTERKSRTSLLNKDHGASKMIDNPLPCVGFYVRAFAFHSLLFLP